MSRRDVLMFMLLMNVIWFDWTRGSCNAILFVDSNFLPPGHVFAILVKKGFLFLIQRDFLHNMIWYYIEKCKAAATVFSSFPPLILSDVRCQDNILTGMFISLLILYFDLCRQSCHVKNHSEDTRTQISWTNKNEEKEREEQIEMRNTMIRRMTVYSSGSLSNCIAVPISE